MRRDDWLDLLVRSIGLEPEYFDTRLKLHYVVRLIPMCERNYNLVELAARHRKIFRLPRDIADSILASGGKTTVPQLFGYLRRQQNPGLIPVWDVVAFDEASGIEFSDATAIHMLKDYMESECFSRGKDGRLPRHPRFTSATPTFRLRSSSTHRICSLTSHRRRLIWHSWTVSIPTSWVGSAKMEQRFFTATMARVRLSL